MFGGFEHPWLDPLWRRVLIVLFCAGWTGLEFFNQDQTWGFIIGAITAYAAWGYLVAYKVTNTDDTKDPDEHE
ncbi:hypothetical protein [Labrenzia sp. PHM005]|uniref:hypothetical protein n=1 Tax=Labrenzia sp. PHM005 TaxID=2590016 RepID=UPI0011402D23|nr:hypothetical protein [Labrenzia sp. PHM005]QDG78971.1 hypothetical protein FJ695_25610 [Labrenzia sp. PHM005]